MDPAELLADQLSGKGRVPSRYDEVQFNLMTGNVALQKPTKAALKAILVQGKTWKEASKEHGIT